MGLRPGRCYREITQQAYTRSAKKVMRKAFVRGVPGSKLHVFNMGTMKGKYDIEVALIAKSKMQLRHQSVEAFRVSTNQVLNRALKEAYYFKIRKYPHHILRENPLASGAGADRFQTGMAKAFGKPIGIAIRVKPGDKLASVFVTKDQVPLAKKALKTGTMKLSGDYSIQIIENPKLTY